MVQRYQKLSNRATVGRFFPHERNGPVVVGFKTRIRPERKWSTHLPHVGGVWFSVGRFLGFLLHAAGARLYILLRNKFRRNKLGTRKARNPNEKTFTWYPLARVATDDGNLVCQNANLLGKSSPKWATYVACNNNPIWNYRHLCIFIVVRAVCLTEICYICMKV